MRESPGPIKPCGPDVQKRRYVVDTAKPDVCHID